MKTIPCLYGMYEDRISGWQGPEARAEEQSDIFAQMGPELLSSYTLPERSPLDVILLNTPYTIYKNLLLYLS